VLVHLQAAILYSKRFIHFQIAITLYKISGFLLLQSESLSSKCTKLHTVEASNNRDHTPQSFFTYASHYVQLFSC